MGEGRGPRRRASAPLRMAQRVLTLACLCFAACRSSDPPRVDVEGTFGSLLGKVLPDVQLATPGGDVVSLQDVWKEGPSVVVLVDEKDCLGCGDYGTEMKILKRELPALRRVVVGIGRDTALFHAYFRENRLEGLLDPESKLLGNDLIRTPLICVLDARGRVLFLDDRSGPEGKGFPISRVLMTLDSAMRSPRDLNPQIGVAAREKFTRNQKEES